MANQEHLNILESGVDVWNEWRHRNPDIEPDLCGVDLSGEEPHKRELTRNEIDSRYAIDLFQGDFHKTNLEGADFMYMNLRECDFTEANLCRASLNNAELEDAIFIGARLLDASLEDARFLGTDFSGADLGAARLKRAWLKWANLQGADLSRANLEGAKLEDADLSYANLTGASLKGASIVGVNLKHARLVEVNLEEVTLQNTSIYGISAWNLNLHNAKQSNLIITHQDEPKITVDDIEVAQFIHLILNNKRLRDVIDTISSKIVLILGRFTPERKKILDKLRDELRKRNYLPVLFDFDKPSNRDFIETVGTLAHLAKFVIADVTEPRIVLEEVPHIVRNIAVPVKPLLLAGSGDEPITLYNLRRNHPLLLDTYHYKDADDLVHSLEEKIIDPAEIKVNELRAT